MMQHITKLEKENTMLKKFDKLALSAKNTIYSQSFVQTPTTRPKIKPYQSSFASTVSLHKVL